MLSMKYTGRINLKEEQGTEKKFSHNNHDYIARGLGRKDKMWRQKDKIIEIFHFEYSISCIYYKKSI